MVEKKPQHLSYLFEKLADTHAHPQQYVFGFISICYL